MARLAAQYETAVAPPHDSIEISLVVGTERQVFNSLIAHLLEQTSAAHRHQIEEMQRIHQESI